MSISSGTSDILGIINSRMSDAGAFLNTGKPPVGREGIYNRQGTGGMSLLNLNSILTAGLSGSLMSGGDASMLGLSSSLPLTNPATSAAGGGMDLSGLATMISQLVAALVQPPAPKASSGSGVASGVLADMAKVKPLEKPAVKPKSGDLTPLGSNGE